MRYRSPRDGTLLRGASLGPVLLGQRRHVDLPVPGRGQGSFAARSALQGFGTLTQGGGLIPVGAGAGAGAAIGASQGASIGSAIVPGIGTAIGALVGAIGGAIAGSLDKRDPEQANFDQAVALWQQNPDNIYAIGNKYLPLAGLFDLNLKNPHIPIYQRYGRMGEHRFVEDLTRLLYQAGQSGQITQADTPLTVMARIVQPWIDSWGYGPMVDPHADMINRLIVGLIMDYVLGRQRSWTARGGDYPFADIPPFALAQAAQPTVTASPTPSPVATTNTPSQVPAVGTPIGYVRDNATGQMIGIPPGGTFAGLTSTNGWLVTYPASSANPGTYESNNGVLVPYGATNFTPSTGAPAGGTSTTQQVVATTTSAPSGGGGYFPTDTSGGAPMSQPMTVTPAATVGGDNSVLLYAVLGLGLLAILGRR